MNTTNNLIDNFKQILGDRYKVIDSYNSEQEIDLNGVIAINISNFENLHHGQQQDYKISVTLNGQTMFQQDSNKAIIYSMFNHVMQSLSVDDICNIEDVAGVIVNGGDIVSDGESNNFSISLDLYVCNVKFE